MIPVDEMLDDLRDKLEAFALDPNHDTFAEIQKETRRMECCCEDVMNPGDDRLEGKRG